MEKRTGSGLQRESEKPVSCHHVCSTFMLKILYENPDSMILKVESKLEEENSTIFGMLMTQP